MSCDVSRPAWCGLLRCWPRCSHSNRCFVLMSPLVGTALGMPQSVWPVLAGTLALGTGCLSMLGGVGAALTVSVRRGSVLLALLVLPLEMPVLIFGARAVDLAMHGEAVAGPLNLLAAVLLFFLSLGPF